MKKNFYFLFVLSFLLLLHKKSNCSLDALTSVIQLDTRYTFTNKAFARGFVKFNKGFDLPVNGTAYLNVGQYIEGIINLNGGTIVMTGPLYLGPNILLNGNGYIKTNGNKIIFANTLSVTTGRLSIKDSIEITSANSGTLFIAPPGKFVISDNNGDLYLRKLNLFCTQPEATVYIQVGNNLWLEDVTWELFDGGILTLTGRVPAFIGSCLFMGRNSTFTIISSNKPWIQGSSHLTIGETATFKIAKLLLQELDSYLALNHKSKLYFTGSDTLTNYGYLKVAGKTTLLSDNNTISFGQSNNIQFLPGSSLFIDKTHLTIT